MTTPKPKKNEAKQDYLKRCTEAQVADGVDQRTAFAKCAANLGEDPATMVLTAPVQMMAADDNQKRSFIISAKTGEPIVRWGWATVIDIAGMKTENRMPVLREHKRDRVVGHGQAFKDDNKLFVEGDFSEATEDAKEVLALADEGYPWQASIGVWAKKVLTLEAGAYETVNGIKVKGPADIWTESFVREVSFVTLGADEDTAAIALAEDYRSFTNNTDKKENIMNIFELRENHPELVKVVSGEAYDKGKADGIEQERGRVIEILNADADLEQTKTAISVGTLSGDAYKTFFEAEKEKRAKGLQDMANGATMPQGQGHDGDEGDPEAGLSADKIVDMRAKQLVRDKGLSYAVASKQVIQNDRVLAGKYRELYSI